MSKELTIGTIYSFKFAGSIIKGELIEIRKTYGNDLVYVFKEKEWKYPINFNDIIFELN